MMCAFDPKKLEFVDIFCNPAQSFTGTGILLENFVFRAIFDLSNKIALLILPWMYALSTKKKQIGEQKFQICLKSQNLGLA